MWWLLYLFSFLFLFQSSQTFPIITNREYYNYSNNNKNNKVNKNNVALSSEHQDTDIVLCKNCKHFIAPESPISIENGYCKLFYKIDYVSGKKNYNSASLSRILASECGNTGKYYLEKRKYISKKKLGLDASSE